MSESGDRATSTVYLATQTRPWSYGDALPNQGHLDTSVPAHAVDLDALRRAAGAPVPPCVRHEPLRLPLARRLTPIGRAAWWLAERLPAKESVWYSRASVK